MKDQPEGFAPLRRGPLRKERGVSRMSGFGTRALVSDDLRRDHRNIGFWQNRPFNISFGNYGYVPKREAIHLEGKLFLNMFGSFSDFSKVK
jgi:hypothetical protein